MFTDYIAVARGYITGCAVAPALLTASNDSPAVGFMTHVTCRLTAKNQDQFRNPALQVYIAVRKVATSLRGLAGHMGSHSVTCHPPLPQPKLVLD